MSRRTCNNIQFWARAEVITFESQMRVPHVEMEGFLIQAFYVLLQLQLILFDYRISA